MNHNKKSPKKALIIIFSLIVFFVIFITMTIVGFFIYVLNESGVYMPELQKKSSFVILITIFGIVSVIVGTIVSLLIGHLPMKPLNTLINSLNKLAAGEYQTRIYFGRHKIGKQLANSFNTLAEELQNTEMLRSDFVNNFSHEFKTPIVSILGFAKLINRGNLSEKQKNEYLEIIEEEAGRLSAMATNVLNMTKIENQNILSDITEFNLSEQLRRCVLLLEKKWTQKNINISIDFNEYIISASEDLLKQVWINLISNAVKFTPEFGNINISIKSNDNNITVITKNNGSKINEQDLNKIFNKFYQADTSHSTEGTGIGLAIAKKITELHNGTINVESNENETVFIVSLPKNL